jgi:hypothetical protein
MTALGSLAFEPVLPIWLLATLTIATLVACLITGGLSGGLRGLATLIVALLALQPQTQTEERERLPDEAIALIDRSSSMTLDTRGADAQRALAALTAQSPGNLRWRTVAVQQPAQGGGTRLFETLDQALARTSSDRLAGVVVITDGVVHDQPDLERLRKLDRPVHVLLAGDRSMSDRRLELVRSPEFGLVGKSVTVAVRFAASSAEPAVLNWAIDARPQPPITLRPGETKKLPIPLTRRGVHRVDMNLARAPGEAVTVNNDASVSISAIREKLKVLLVSGTPYPGARLWRDILKGDGSIDLMHFTILRLPTSIDPTPVDELSLIPFPVDQLFEQHLHTFDLVVFDRFGALDLLPPEYLENVTQFVERGGGLLLTTGQELARPDNLATTTLAAILPIRPTGQILRMPFRFTLTDLGRRHPVTNALEPAWGQGRAWGRWDEQAGATLVGDLQLLATGAQSSPLLLLSRKGKGRVATLLSDQVWFWARDIDGGGPRDELFRRLIHWLMQEPELAEEILRVTAERSTGLIERQSLKSDAMAAQIQDPQGVGQSIDLPAAADGKRRARFPLTRPGRYTVEAGGQTATLFWQGPDPIELRQVTPTDERLRPVTRATNGRLSWLSGGNPQVRRTSPNAQTHGADWIGLQSNDAGRLLSVRRDPLIPPLAALGLAFGLIGVAWAIERR